MKLKFRFEDRFVGRKQAEQKQRRQLAVTVCKRVSRGKGDSPQAVDKIICRKKRYKTRRRTNQALRPEFFRNRMRSAAPWPCECRCRRLTQPTLSPFGPRRPRCRRRFFLHSFVLSAIRPLSTTRARVWFVETSIYSNRSPSTGFRDRTTWVFPLRPCSPTGSSWACVLFVNPLWSYN